MRPGRLLLISSALTLSACARTGLDAVQGLESVATTGNDGGGGAAPSGGSAGSAGGGTGGIGDTGGAGGTGEPVWSATAGALDAMVSPNAMAVDEAGNALIAGVFSGTVDFGGGPLTSVGVHDTFVLKLDPVGHHLWSKRFGSAYGKDPDVPGPVPSASATGVAVDGDGNIVLAGGFDVSVDFGGGPLTGRSDIFVAKLDPDGNHLWSRGYGDDEIYQLGWGVAVDGGGNALVIGSFNGTVDFGGGPFTTNGIDDVFVLKLDPDGDHVWSRQFGDDEGNQQGFAIAADAAGNVAITGFHDGPVDFGGGPLPFPGGGPHGLELFIARLDPDGQHVWSRGFADGDHISAGNAITFDAAGNVLVAGDFHVSLDLGKGTLQSTWPYDGGETLFVAKLGPDGETLWSKAASGASGKGTSRAFGIATSGPGDVVVTGTFHDTLDLGEGPLESEGLEAIFVAGLSPDGETRWSRSFGDDPPYQEGRAAAALPQGGWLVTGMFAGTVDFGSGPQTSPGLTSLFVTAFEP